MDWNQSPSFGARLRFYVVVYRGNLETDVCKGRSNMVMPSIQWEVVEREAKEIVQDIAIKQLTWGVFKNKLAAALDITVNELKQHKTKLQGLIASMEEADDEEKEGQDDGEHGDSSTEDNEEGDAMRAMRSLARAMNLGPRPLQGLKQMSKEKAEKILKERLMAAGAQIKGPFPSSREIAQARRRTERKNDLDGMDLGNVVQGSRRRSRSDDDISWPEKKRRSVDQLSGGSHSSSGCSGKDSGDEESEREFEL